MNINPSTPLTRQLSDALDDAAGDPESLQAVRDLYQAAAHCRIADALDRVAMHGETIAFRLEQLHSLARYSR